MRVLIAEDDITSRAVLTAILKKWGYDPVAVEDGSSAWDIMQKPDAPPLALLDWEMPGMNGLEVCRNIRDNNPPSPPYLIILTSGGGKADIVAGLDAGANAYISKPYDNRELQARSGVVEAIQKRLRGDDLVGRYGGEEFLVVAPDAAGSAVDAIYVH